MEEERDRPAGRGPTSRVEECAARHLPPEGPTSGNLSQCLLAASREEPTARCQSGLRVAMWLLPARKLLESCALGAKHESRRAAVEEAQTCALTASVRQAAARAQQHHVQRTLLTHRAAGSTLHEGIRVRASPSEAAHDGGGSGTALHSRVSVPTRACHQRSFS